MSREALREVLAEGRVVLRPDVANARFEGSLVLSHEEFIEQKQIDIKLVAGARFEPAEFRELRRFRGDILRNFFRGAPSMWFKNLTLYRLPADWKLSAAELEEKLAQRTLQPCSPLEMVSRGWVAPSSTGRMLRTVNGQHLIALGVDQKLLPGSIIRQEAERRAVTLADSQGFPVGRRQMRDLKMRVTEELRARALSRRRMTRAWIDPINGWFVVDAGSANKAEELVEALRDLLGSFAVQFVETQRTPHTSMAAWLTHGDAPGAFGIDQDLELQTADPNKATVRYVRHALDGKEIKSHLASGKYPTRMGLTWNGRVSFVLTEKLQIKRVEFLEMTKDTADGGEVDKDEQFDIDFTVMAGELAKMLDDLLQALGGDNARQETAAAA
jgi:recombination associated protein RdgC